MKRTLDGLSEIRQHFFRDPTPVWHVCATPYTLLGMDEWVRGFRWISYSDCFDGAHPRVFAPVQRVAETFPYQLLEEMNNDLLRHEQVQEHIRLFGPGQITAMMFDEETCELAARLGLEMTMPAPSLRRQVDDKLETTRIGDRAGVPSVPNALGRATTWEELQALGAGLGQDLVVQTAYGDSGTTTFFIASEEDFKRYERAIVAETEVKVMRRIKPMQAAIEGCVTREGTVVGPLMTEVIGFPELTPFKGGWAGNEVVPEAFTTAQRDAASKGTARFGDALRDLGYRGYFEIDWLIDQNTGEMYLGEVNPRLSGASPLTNLAAFAHADAPLFLFHLLEYSDLEFRLDVDRLNKRWAHPDNHDDWSQLIVKYTDEDDLRLTNSPPSGVWRLNDDNTATFRFAQTHRRTVEGDRQAFFLRIPRNGDLVRHADDLGILVFRGRAMTPGGDLTENARRWIDAIRAHFEGERTGNSKEG
jgi:D-alanine-D-alanine ligase-like ATP-grasp enzyme